MGGAGEGLDLSFNKQAGARSGARWLAVGLRSLNIKNKEKLWNRF